MPKPKPKTHYAKTANAGRLAGIAAGSFFVGMAANVLRPVFWLLGVVLGILQVAALCSAVVLFVHWLVGRFYR